MNIPKPGTIGWQWRELFIGNQQLAKRDKATDGQLQRMMRASFPGRSSGEFTDVAAVQAVRSRYNRGFYGPIKKESHQYDSNGNVIYPRGRPANKKRKVK